MFSGVLDIDAGGVLSGEACGVTGVGWTSGAVLGSVPDDDGEATTDGIDVTNGVPRCLRSSVIIRGGAALCRGANFLRNLRLRRVIRPEPPTQLCIGRIVEPL